MSIKELGKDVQELSAPYEPSFKKYLTERDDLIRKEKEQRSGTFSQLFPWQVLLYFSLLSQSFVVLVFINYSPYPLFLFKHVNENQKNPHNNNLATLTTSLST